MSGELTRAANHFGHPGKLYSSLPLLPYHVSLWQPKPCLQMHSEENSPGYAVKFGRNCQLCKQPRCVNNRDCHCGGVALQWVEQTLWHTVAITRLLLGDSGERLAFWEFMCLLLMDSLLNGCRETRAVKNLPQDRKRWQNPIKEKLCPHRTRKDPNALTHCTLASQGFWHLCILASPWMPQTFRRPQSCIWPHCHPWQHWCQTLQETDARSKS